MIEVTFIKSHYTSQKHSQAYLREAIEMMEGSIVAEDTLTVSAKFPTKNKSKELILFNANFWANIR